MSLTLRLGLRLALFALLGLAGCSDPGPRTPAADDTAPSDANGDGAETPGDVPHSDGVPDEDAAPPGPGDTDDTAPGDTDGSVQDTQDDAAPPVDDASAVADVETEGEDAHDAVDPSDPPLWLDAATLADGSTLAVREVGRSTSGIGLARVEHREVRYTSWQVTEGVLEPIEIEAHIATPAGRGPFPAVVVAHGLGGRAERDSAILLARRWGMVVIAYSGPGNGASEGRGSGQANSLWNTEPDPRGSWFWGHATAAARAITLAETLPEVRSTFVAMTGYSAGAIATLHVNGFDTRLRAAVPISGTGDLANATAAGGWQNDLLREESLSADGPHFQRWLATLDPLLQAHTAHAPTLLINGTQDQFFPIDSTLRTFAALPGDHHRLLLIPNWDHGQFAMLLPHCGTFDNRTYAARRVETAQTWWLRRHLTDLGAYHGPLAVPTVEVSSLGGFLLFSATWAGSQSVHEVHVYASADRAWTFAGTRLDNRQGSRWWQLTAFPTSTFPEANVVALATVRVSLPGTEAGELWLTSLPRLPEDFVPRIRPIDPARCGER